MSKPTKEQLSDPKWWDKNAPEWAEYYSPSADEWGAGPMVESPLPYRYLRRGELEEPGWRRLSNDRQTDIVCRPHGQDADK